ncbi:hypothetical protein C8R46DRAFT_432233 [Mycena filopes]|nr:hypothetical protein C8R46DRAFT_432233 [Mycena filopes]
MSFLRSSPTRPPASPAPSPSVQIARWAWAGFGAAYTEGVVLLDSVWRHSRVVIARALHTSLNITRALSVRRDCVSRTCASASSVRVRAALAQTLRTPDTHPLTPPATCPLLRIDPRRRVDGCVVQRAGDGDSDVGCGVRGLWWRRRRGGGGGRDRRGERPPRRHPSRDDSSAR